MLFPRPFDKWNTYPKHVGIDYPEPNDAVVMASGKGIVTFSGWFSERAGYGVSVTHDNKVFSYKHSDESDWRANVGTPVELGTPIMEVGKLGLGSTGYHLHHEVFVNGLIQTDENYWKYIDKSPNGYIQAALLANVDSEDFNKVIVKDDMMKLLFVQDNGDGNNNPAWWLINTVTGEFIFLVKGKDAKNQERANSWAKIWGNAIPVNRQDALNAIDAIKRTK